jgi:hypothetical protein
VTVLVEPSLMNDDNESPSEDRNVATSDPSSAGTDRSLRVLLLVIAGALMVSLVVPMVVLAVRQGPSDAVGWLIGESGLLAAFVGCALAGLAVRTWRRTHLREDTGSGPEATPGQ